MQYSSEAFITMYPKVYIYTMEMGDFQLLTFKIKSYFRLQALLDRLSLDYITCHV